MVSKKKPIAVKEPPIEMADLDKLFTDRLEHLERCNSMAVRAISMLVKKVDLMQTELEYQANVYKLGK